MEKSSSTILFAQDSIKTFRYLYDKYVTTLRYFASKYINEDAVIEDVVQDAFLSLWEKKENFQEEQAIKAYLYKAVRSYSIDNIRHNKVEQKYVNRIIATETEHEFFLENILESEVFQMIQSVFNELSPACQMVYQLSLDGKSHEEISNQLNISINTVKKHKNNANHYMRERLKNLLAFLLWL